MYPIYLDECQIQRVFPSTATNTKIAWTPNNPRAILVAMTGFANLTVVAAFLLLLATGSRLIGVQEPGRGRLLEAASNGPC